MQDALTRRVDNIFSDIIASSEIKKKTRAQSLRWSFLCSESEMVIPFLFYFLYFLFYQDYYPDNNQKTKNKKKDNS